MEHGACRKVVGLYGASTCLAKYDDLEVQISDDSRQHFHIRICIPYFSLIPIGCHDLRDHTVIEVGEVPRDPVHPMQLLLGRPAEGKDVKR